jgi:hypothetical protein
MYCNKSSASRQANKANRLTRQMNQSIKVPALAANIFVVAFGWDGLQFNNTIFNI